MLTSSKKIPWSFLTLLTLAFVVYLQHSWVQGMFPDGHLYMAFGKNAVENGNWLIPHLSKAIYPEFPDHLPLIFILEGIFFKVFGSGYSSGRIFSGLFTISSFILVWKLGKRQNEKVAFFSGFIFLIIPALIKKTRFPGLDIPLMFFSLTAVYFFVKYLEDKENHNIIGAGLFWGLSLLTKGPIAFFVPLGLLISILINKNWKLLKDIKLYVIIFIGLLVFLIWPLSLYLNEKTWVLGHYYHSIFIHSATKGRNIQELNFFSYWIFLFKQTAPFLALLFYGFWKSFQSEKKDQKIITYFSLFMALIIPLSFFRLKYSHYLIPLYPYLALVGGFALFHLVSNKFFKMFSEKLLPGVVYIGTLVLLIFPLTIDSKRDKELQKMLQLSKGFQKVPKQWGIINNSYSFYNVVNMMAYRNKGEVFKISTKIFSKILKKEDISLLLESEWKQETKYENWVFIVKKDYWQNFLVKGNLKNTFKIVAHFKKENILFVVHQSFLSDSLSFP